MAQRIDFAPIPNTQPIAYWQTLVLVFGEVRRSRPDAKALREFLRMRNLYDKETFPTLADFLELRLGDPCELGPFAARLLDAPDEAAAREAMAARLIDQNPLLAKYCLEAMDAEHGGRLHSTNELYRMITSYVYPGTKPTLVSFKAWVEWAVAAGLIKLVGIRWALAGQGTAALPRLRAIDAEEFLEEERAASAGPSEAEEEPEPVSPHAPPPAATTSASAVPAAQASAAPVAQASAAPAPTPSAPAAGVGPTTSATPRPAAPTRVVRPVAAVVERPFTPAPVGPDLLAADRDALLAWYEQYPGRRPVSAAMAGVDVSRKSPSLVFECAFAALLLARGIAPAAAMAAMEAFRAGGVLLALGKGRFPTDALASLIARNPDPGFISACEATVHLPRLLAGTADVAALVHPEDPRELLWGLWRRLYEPVAPLAPFFLARFLFEAGMLRAANAGLIPSFTVRENAFRIGFLDRLHATSFADLVEAATALAAWFGPPAFEEPLGQVHEAYGCGFRCGRAAVCPLACREKGEVAAAP